MYSKDIEKGSLVRIMVFKEPIWMEYSKGLCIYLGRELNTHHLINCKGPKISVAQTPGIMLDVIG